ncbi:MAG: hypothetical protein BWY73_00228 [candidate division TA06 bacterium ADurb.Bin417]|uniref:Uncharacterized protein n=1 Tax=candidate division TA06 bacterium ADurb.Bin417 TaxID=1852828 RepID=A0A1V5MKF9_UNCT6|nr:MAG: hypothetical protein BWY73_00228 [candidate division TA06 bacterium ADurb.Bin417]
MLGRGGGQADRRVYVVDAGGGAAHLAAAGVPDRQRVGLDEVGGDGLGDVDRHAGVLAGRRVNVDTGIDRPVVPAVAGVGSGRNVDHRSLEAAGGAGRRHRGPAAGRADGHGQVVAGYLVVSPGEGDAAVLGQVEGLVGRGEVAGHRPPDDRVTADRSRGAQGLLVIPAAQGAVGEVAVETGRTGDGVGTGLEVAAHDQGPGAGHQLQVGQLGIIVGDGHVKAADLLVDGVGQLNHQHLAGRPGRKIGQVDQEIAAGILLAGTGQGDDLGRPDLDVGVHRQSAVGRGRTVRVGDRHDDRVRVGGKGGRRAGAQQ